MDFRFVHATTSYEKEMAHHLLLSRGLMIDDHVTETINLYVLDECIGTISYDDNVIKMIAVKENHEKENLTGVLLQYVMRLFEVKGIGKYFLFTPLQNAIIFQNLGLKLISQTEHIALFENAWHPIDQTLEKLASSISFFGTKRAGIVMNCNPITLGHLYLIETCAKENDDVIIFLVETNRSVFPFDIRFRLVKEATKHMKNVHILPSTPYIISPATFPTYFLKEVSEASDMFIQLDLTIFKEHFFKVFKLTSRYVGTEPLDLSTAHYNEAMKKIFGSSLHVIERLERNQAVISASKVRELMKNHAYDELKKWVPEATYQFLLSSEGKALFL
jgi:[citrate (pro-3S)-lyase] ligase